MIEQGDQLFFEEGLEEEESSFDIKRYINAIVQKKWLIVIITVVLSVPWLLFVKSQAPIYEAETILKFKNLDGTNLTLLNDRITELSSRRFAEKVVQQLGLCFEMEEIPEYEKKINRHRIFQEFATTDEPKYGKYSLKFDDFGKFVLTYYPEDYKQGIPIDSGYVSDYIYTPLTRNGFSFTFVETLDSLPKEIPFRINRFRNAVDALLARKQTGLRGGGTLLSLKMTGSDPVLVTQTVNRLADVYKQESMYIKESDSGQKLNLLNKRLKIAEENLKRSQADLKAFEEKYFISFDTDVVTQQSDREILIGKRDELEETRKQLTSMMESLETEIGTNGGYGYSRNLKVVFDALAQLPTFSTNSEMNIARSRLSQLEGDRDEKLRTVTESHESIKQFDAQISLVFQEMHNAAKKHLNSIRYQLRQTNGKIASIDKRLNMLPQESQRRTQLASEVTRNQALYDNLKNEVLTAQVTQSAESETIEVFQKAIIPEYPINKDKKTRAIMGVVMSLVLGLGVVVLIEFLDKSIKSADDIKKYLKKDILGTIPEIEFKGTDEYKDEEKIKQIDNQLVTHDYSPTPIGEAYRSLRTNLLFSKKTGKIQSLVITSTAPGDGKSFTSSNVAISMAQQRSNTLLVDADLRRGVLHNTFGISKEPGFTNVLTNSHTFNQAIKETYIPNLSVLSCGSLLPNPSELLGSLQMKRFLEQAQRRFDMIIFDSPPLNAATDAVVIGTQVDGVVVVVRVGVTKRDVAKAKLEMFKNVPANVLGVVLNGGDANLAHEAYSYYHY